MAITWIATISDKKLLDSDIVIYSTSFPGNEVVIYYVDNCTFRNTA